MKINQIIPIFALLLVSWQMAIAQTLSSSVYFESGKHELNETALKQLQDFIENARKHKDFDLSLTAYTDDIGTEKYNKELAEKRAATIFQLLEKGNLRPTESEIKPVGAVALEENKDADAQRRQNRRVDIELHIFEPKSVSDFYNFFSNRKSDEHLISTDRDEMIICKQGTQLFIPAGSLQLANGDSISSDNVIIHIREAYSYSDMIFNNLTTTSNKKLIETAGMLQIEATTLDGQALVLRPGAEMILNMYSKNELNEEMELFYADRAIDSTKVLSDWQAAGQNFLSTNFDKKVAKLDFSNVRFNYIDTIKSPEISPWPTVVELMKLPVEPIMAKPKNTTMPSAEEIALKNPRLENESEIKHKERLLNATQRAQKQCEINLRTNQNAEKQHLVDMENYKKAMATYELEKANFEAQETAIKNLREEVKAKKEELDLWFKKINWAANGFDQSVAEVVEKQKTFKKLCRYLAIECKRLKMEEDLQTVKNVSMKDADLMMRLGNLFIRCSKNNIQFNLNKNIAARGKRIKELLSEDNKDLALYASDSDEDNLQNIHSLIMDTYKHAELQNELIDNYNKVLLKSNFAKHAQQLDSVCKVLITIQEKVMEEKAKRGWVSPMEGYSNIATITNFGLINCDRFLDNKWKNLVVLSVERDEYEDEETVYVAIFSSVRGVMPMYPSAQGGFFTAANIPSDENVKIVGIKILEDGLVSVAIMKGLASEMKKMKPEYKVYSLADLKNILS